MGKRRKMEKVAAIENSVNFYPLARNFGPWKPGVNEVIKESDGTLTQSKDHRLSNCYQFSWPWPQWAFRFCL